MEKNEVYQIVKQSILEVLPDLNPELISIEKQLRDLGANSIDRTEIVTISMEQIGLKIPLMSFASVSNIEGMVDVLTENSMALKR